MHLRDLCTVNQGLQIPISKRFKSPGPNRLFYITVQFLKAGHKEKYYVENPPESCICTEDDLIVVRTGSTGQLVTGVHGCFHNNFFKVNPIKNKILSKYIYYCLLTPQKQNEMRTRSGITTIPDLNHFMFLDMKIPWVPIERQFEIVDLLDTLSAKIELNNRINAELESLAKLIYDYWFVQFDFPMSKEQAAALGNPELEGKPYKSSGGKMVHNEELKREVPEGWEVVPLLDVVDWQGGSQPPKSTFVYEKTEGYVRFIQNRDYASESHYTFIPIANSNKCCDRYDIMMDKYGDAGRIRFGLEGAYNVALSKIAMRREGFQEYIRQFLASPSIYEFLNSSCSASTRASLNENNLSYVKVVIPEENILGRFESEQKKMIDLQLTKLDENQELSSLREWLLPMLMNGQVRVKGSSASIGALDGDDVGMAAEAKKEYTTK